MHRLIQQEAFHDARRKSTANPGRSPESGPGHVSAGTETIYREWLGLRDLTRYANVSERTLRSWIYSPVDPLPAVKVSGKVLVRKRDFDTYLERHRIRPLEEINVDAVVRDLMRGATNGR